MNNPILKLDKSVYKSSTCPITNVLDVFGDKWTILIVRDIVLGKERYEEFLSSPEKISTNILAGRLKRLLDADIIVRRAYQYKPVRYAYILTSRGEGLKSVLQVLATWGLKNFPGTEVLPSKLGTESRHLRRQRMFADKEVACNRKVTREPASTLVCNVVTDVTDKTGTIAH